jgi:ribonuclease P protein component
MTLARLKRRAEFLKVQAARRRWVAPGLVLQVAVRDGEGAGREEEPRVGFTASRKVGNAVARNRARRRLRALAREVLEQSAAPGRDYVLVARAASVDRPYALLRQDLVEGLRRLAAWRQQEPAKSEAEG